MLSRYLDGIIIRTHAHSDLETFAKNASIPIINGLTDLSHPCQVLTDLFTILEMRGSYKNQKIVYLGDCNNNMSYSWMLGASLLGYHLVLSGHPDYQPHAEQLKETGTLASALGGSVNFIENPSLAVSEADVLYSDVWTSMGQEEESGKRKNNLGPWQVNQTLLSHAKKDALFMHCLPAHRGEEVTDEVLDGPHSIVFDQAENRMHVQKAILTLIGAS